MKFKSKQIVFDAMQFTGTNTFSIVEWMNEGLWPSQPTNVRVDIGNGHYLEIQTPEGGETVRINDWIIKNVEGEFYSMGDYVWTYG